jgi:hypothetical protein
MLHADSHNALSELESIHLLESMFFKGKRTGPDNSVGKKKRKRKEGK